MTQPTVPSQSGAAYEPARSPAPDTPASPPPQPSIWEDFIDIFYAPAAVFARREKSGFWAPTLIVAALVGVIFFASRGALQPMLDAEIDRQIAAAVRQNPQAAPMADRMRGGIEMTMTVMAFLGVPIVVLLTGLALWIVSRLVDARQSLKTSCVVVAYACVPRVLLAVLVALQGLLLAPEALDGRYRVTFSAARFLDPSTTSPLTLALLGNLDLFTIWFAVLLTIGLSVTGKIGRSRAAVAAIIVVVLGALPEILGAMRS